MRASLPHVLDAGAGRSTVRPAPATLRGSLIGLHRRAGNRAVGELLRRASAGVLQRKVGWSNAVTDGYAWNADERQVGSIRRIPLDELPVGLPNDAPITELTPEKTERRAIVLLPKALDATQQVEYLVFLHGHTEDSSTRPFAGWRAYKPPPPKGKAPPPKKAKDETSTERLRHGIDPTDVAPVRDVALDEAEKQLEDSGLTQLVIVLPQGALTSEFGDAGDKNFDAGDYVGKIAARLLSEHCWLGPDGKPVTNEAPKVKRITMAGHSGAGATLSNMTNEAVRAILPPGAKGAPKAVPSSPLTGDLVIFDAINGSQLGAFQKWVETRLNEDLKVLTGGMNESEKLKYLQSAPRLRGFFTDLYKDPYAELEGTIRAWFKKHGSELGPFARCLRANFMLTHVAVQHERLMHGIGSGQTRTGGIFEALQSLHRPLPTSAAGCPKMPEELEEERQRKKQERKDRSKGHAPAPRAKVKTGTA